MNDLEISKMLTISTAHLTEDDAVYLDNACYFEADDDLIVYAKGYCGWFVYMPDDLNEYNLSKNLKHIFALAKIFDCVWICFDVDGCVIKELNTYNW